MPSEDRRVGKLLPSPVDPETTVCYTIRIPNAVQYRAAFLGQLDVLGQALTWDHPRDGTDCPDCEEAAQLWRKALYEATFSDDCETDMSCEDVADCIETDEAVQANIITIVNNSLSQSVTNTNTYPLGVSNPEPDYNLATGTNPECSHDILWAQCLAIAMETNAAITDVIEQIEVVTNSVELIDAASEIPIVGWAKEALGGQAMLDLIQYYQETIGEEYASQYTLTAGGVQDQIACAIFCACKEDCEITLNRLFDVMLTRASVYITVPELTTLIDLIEFVAGISQDNTMVVDVAFLFAWAGARLGNFLFGKTFDIGLSLILQLSANDPSSDWETLCVDCPSDPITLTKVGYAGQVFGVVPATVESGDAFDVSATVGPASANDRLFSFVFDAPCNLNVNSTTWTFCATGDPSSALWGYCPTTAPDPTNLGYWIFTREGTATDIPHPINIDCKGIWLEGACGVAFTANITLTKL